MVGAEAVGDAVPLRRAEGFACDVTDRERALVVGRKRRVLRIDGQETIGVLGLDPALAVDAEQARELGVGHAFEQPRVPPEPRGRDHEGANGVSDVMVAVAEGPLTILPGLAPMYRGEPDEQASWRKLTGERGPGLVGQLRAPLERVLVRRVVIDGWFRMKTLDGPGDEITLGGMEVPARRVDP